MTAEVVPHQKTTFSQTSKMDKLRRALSGDDSQRDEESGIMPQVDYIQISNANFLFIINKSVPWSVTNHMYFSFQLLDSTALSWETRVKGFIICFVIGVLCSVLGSLCLLMHNGMTLFAVFYTLGNIISIARWVLIYEVCQFVKYPEILLLFPVI